MAIKAQRHEDLLRSSFLPNDVLGGTAIGLFYNNETEQYLVRTRFQTYYVSKMGQDQARALGKAIEVFEDMIAGVMPRQKRNASDDVLADLENRVADLEERSAARSIRKIQRPKSPKNKSEKIYKRNPPDSKMTGEQILKRNRKRDKWKRSSEDLGGHYADDRESGIRDIFKRIDDWMSPKDTRQLKPIAVLIEKVAKSQAGDKTNMWVASYYPSEAKSLMKKHRVRAGHTEVVNGIYFIQVLYPWQDQNIALYREIGRANTLRREYTTRGFDKLDSKDVSYASKNLQE